MPPRTALLLGATGLVGRHCLDLLLADDAYAAVTTLARRPLDRTHPKLTQHVVDFDRLSARREMFAVQDAFCCLGTTMKEAGSKAAFRKVDYTYPLEAAQAAAGAGAEQYLLVSAIGANAKSRIFYNRVKGEVEDAVGALPFYGTYVFRPSLLTGTRDTPRPGEQVSEKIMDALSFALKGPLRRYRPIEAAQVARAMVRVAKDRPGGLRRYQSDEIVTIGR